MLNVISQLHIKFNKISYMHIIKTVLHYKLVTLHYLMSLISEPIYIYLLNEVLRTPYSLTVQQKPPVAVSNVDLIQSLMLAS